MDFEIRRRLIKLSQIRGATIPINYLIQELSLGYDLESKADRNDIIELLNDISRFEFENNRPLLSSLVKGKSKMKKALQENFLSLCRELKTLPEPGKEGEIEAFKPHQLSCHEFWSNSDNMKKYADVSHLLQ